MALEQPVQCGSIHARQPCRARHVARCPGHQPSDVVLLECRQHLLFGDVISVARRQNAYSVAHGAEIDFLIEREVVNLNLGAGLPENGDVLDEILELADITTPRPRGEEVESIFAECRRGVLCRTVPSPENAQEVIR